MPVRLACLRRRDDVLVLWPMLSTLVVVLWARRLGRYCGVSYLVFSEVKALERRTLAAEQTVADWKACTLSPHVVVFLDF